MFMVHGWYGFHALDGIHSGAYLRFHRQEEGHMSESALHVVFGAGQVGAGLARELRARGLRVRVVRRSARPVVEGAEVVVGDARDPAFATRAAEGAAVVYHCMNPSAYTATAWEAETPAQGEALIAASLAARARLVVLDNLYGYGEVRGPRREDTPLLATGRKGQVRVRWAARLEHAAQEEGLRYVSGRAGDFFGPGTTDQSLLTERDVVGLCKGKRPWLIGDPSATHAFSWVPDVVSALASMGVAEPDVEGSIFHLPVVEVAPGELVERLAQSLGVTTRHRRARRPMLRALSPIVPFFREVLETLYQWEQPFLVDDSAFLTRFARQRTPVEEAVAMLASRVTSPALADAEDPHVR